jgi:hypothetical protein
VERHHIPLHTFYLSTHHGDWFSKTDVPLVLSRRRLAQRQRLPRARGPWALDFYDRGFEQGTNAIDEVNEQRELTVQICTTVLAWSYGARRGLPLPDCRSAHARCNNRIRYALRWQEGMLRPLDIDAPVGGALRGQPRLFPGTLCA